MAYGSVNEDGRLTNIIWDDSDIDDLPEADQPAIREMFPVHIENGDLIFNTASHCNEDFVIEGGMARYDPLPESVALIQEEFKQDIKQAKIDGLLEFIDSGALSLLQERG